VTDVTVSLFASSIRHEMYDEFFASIQSEEVAIETVFAGHRPPQKQYPNLTYIETGNIKPAQCYEVSRRACKGDVVVWVADDCEFIGKILTKAYQYWKAQNNEKLILSLQTREAGLYAPKEPKVYSMNVHRFFGGQNNTPLMAPLGMMSRKYLDQLGGIDRRYICGQYENDIVMRALQDGGKVEVFGDRDCHVWIDHVGKAGSKQAFIDRPFGTGYPIDRKVLEKSWVRNDVVWKTQQDHFEPYEDKDILTVNQSNAGIWA
jgi:hypothetical protein